MQKSIDEEIKSNDEINAESKQQILKPTSEEDSQAQSETISKHNNQSRSIEASKESRTGLIDSKASSIDKDTVDHVESGSITQVVAQESIKPETNEHGIYVNLLLFFKPTKNEFPK